MLTNNENKYGIAVLSCCLALAPLNMYAGDANAEALQAAKDAAKKATTFLSDQANDDGTFGKDPTAKMPGIVALVLFALANSTDKPDAKLKALMDKSAAYLVSNQQPDGAIAVPMFRNENYNTSTAAMALKALNDPKYKDVLDKARTYILSCQLDDSKGYQKDVHSRAYGGFGYGSAKRADLSNTTFSLEALKELGVKEDSPAFKNALTFLRRCQDNLETNDVKEMKNGESTGGFVYLPGESEFGTYKTPKGVETPKPYGSMTYAGIKALIYCGLDEKSPELAQAFKWAKENYSVSENPGADGTKGYYYYAVTFAKAFTASGLKEMTLEDGRKVYWARDLATHLAKLQNPNGSFLNPDPKWMEGDAILVTSYGLTALNLCNQALAVAEK